MKHTKKQIEEIVRQLLNDIDRTYFEHEKIYIEFKENLEVLGSIKTIKFGWDIGVPVEDDQFHKPEGSGILIYLDDETGEIVSYLDCSMGRPVPLAAKKGENGKYQLTAISG